MRSGTLTPAPKSIPTFTSYDKPLLRVSNGSSNTVPVRVGEMEELKPNGVVGLTKDKGEMDSLSRVTVVEASFQFLKKVDVTTVEGTVLAIFRRGRVLKA